MSESVNNFKNLVFSINDLTKLLEDNERDSITSAAAVKSIKEKCTASDPMLSVSALHALTKMVESGRLPMSNGLSILISMLSSKEAVPSIVSAVGRLLFLDASRSDYECPYNLMERPHPFIIMLKHDWMLWSEVSAVLSNLFFGDSTMKYERKIECMRPVMSYVISDPAAPMMAKTEIIELLISCHDFSLLIDLFSWQQMGSNWCTLLRQIAQKGLKNEKLYEILAPALAVAVSYLVKNGTDSSLWIHYLRQCVTENNVDLVLNILAEIIPSCPSINLIQIIKFCHFLISKQNCNLWSAGAVAAAILPWAISPSNLIPNLTEYLHEILKILPKLEKNRKIDFDIFGAFIDSMPIARLSLDSLILCNQWIDDASLLKNLEDINCRKWKRLLLAVLLCSKTIGITKLVLNHLKEMCKTDPSFCFPVWSVVLYKLSKETDPHLQISFLRMVPFMGIDKGNMSLVLGTYNTLSSASIPLRLNFLFSLFAIQRRTFPYLHRLLQDASMNTTWEAQVACAAVLLKIARISPDLHGKQIIGLLSDILNKNSGESGAEATTMAVTAISELCRASVIDIQPTWKALESKMANENRPAVAEAICGLLGEAADYEMENFRKIAISRLWSFVESNNAPHAAFIALEKFNLDDFQLKEMPERFRKNLVIPKTFTVENNQARPEDVLSYVPGECWVQILEKTNTDRKNAVQEMLKNLIKKEIADLPRGIYSLPLGDEEPRNFAHLPHKSLLRAFVETLQKIIRNGWKDTKLATMILNILGNDFLRPIPPLNWSFLEKDLSEHFSAFMVLARQCTKSPSAKKIIKEYKINVTLDNVSEICQVLPWISQCVPKFGLSALIGDLLRITLDDSNLFKNVLAAVRKCVALSDVPNANRTVIANALKELLVDLPAEIEDIEELWTSLGELPDPIIERITCAQNWPEITTRRLRHALRVLRASGLKNDQNADIFSNLIDDTRPRPEDQNLVKEELVIFFNQISPKSGSESFRLLLIHLFAAIKIQAPNNEINFLYHLLLHCAVVLSGYNLLLTPQNKLLIFSGCVQALFNTNSPEWMKNLPFAVECFYYIGKSAELDSEKRDAVHRILLSLRHHNYFLESSRWEKLFY